MTIDPAELIVKPEADLEDLIPDFMNNRRNDMVEINDAVSRKDFLFIRRMAHTLKGISRPYGFIYLETLSKKLEQAGEAENFADVQALAAEIEYYINNLRIEYSNAST